MLEIPLSFLFGWLTDLYDLVIPAIPGPLPLQIDPVRGTMFLTAMGVFLCVKTNLVLTPHRRDCTNHVTSVSPALLWGEERV